MTGRGIPGAAFKVEYQMPDGTTVLEFTFANYPYGSLLISKVDALTATPLTATPLTAAPLAGARRGTKFCAALYMPLL